MLNFDKMLKEAISRDILTVSEKLEYLIPMVNLSLKEMVND